jgi:hypothetical protein
MTSVAALGILAHLMLVDLGTVDLSTVAA